jgi:signal transduction histidine kinase
MFEVQMESLGSKSETHRSFRWRHYVIAIAWGMIALPLIIFRKEPAAEVNLRLLLLTSVMLSSWSGGFGPGLVTTFLASLAIGYSYLPVGNSAYLVRLVEFIVVALLITFLNERRRKAQRRAEVAQTEAEAANHEKDEFIATISHELRTPLSAVIGWTKFLQEHDDRAFRREALEVIERNAIKESQLIEDLLDISRMNAGHFGLDVGPTDLAGVIQAAIEVVRPDLELKGLQLRTQIEEQSPRLLADSRRLQQVVWNLLSNAAKFTPEGGVVELQLTYTETHACIAVKDSGIGIDAALLPHVFERFWQGDLSKKRHGGLGLGLAIARELTELHGGTIEVESQGKGQGSSFIVKLPLTKDGRELTLLKQRAVGPHQPSQYSFVSCGGSQRTDNK